jgi:hypothetical protein
MPYTKGGTEGMRGGMCDEVPSLHEWLKLNTLVTFKVMFIFTEHMGSYHTHDG